MQNARLIVLIKIAVLLVFACALISAFSGRNRSYFPGSKDSRWEYTQYNFNDGEMTTGTVRNCVGDTTIQDKTYFMIGRMDSTGKRKGENYRWEGTKLFKYNSKSNREILMLDISMKSGDTFSFSVDTVHYEAKVLSTDTTFNYFSKSRVCRGLRLGVDIKFKFTHTYCVEYVTEVKAPPKGFRKDRYELYFKKGVGLVGAKFTNELMWLTRWKIKR